MLSASDSPVARDLLELYRHAAKHLLPSFVRTTGPRFRSGEIWQGLTLPIKLADGVVILVCYSEQVSHHREVYEFLFQNSPEAMLVASPIANDVGDAVDGWVVMVNDAARRLLDFTDGIGSLRIKHLPQLKYLDLQFQAAPTGPAGNVGSHRRGPCVRGRNHSLHQRLRPPDAAAGHAPRRRHGSRAGACPGVRRLWRTCTPVFT